MNALIYDIEIKKAILGKNEKPIASIEYCAGWSDHANMGVSCVGAYDYVEDRYRMFMDDNLSDFFKLMQQRELLVGFNHIAFDNAVLVQAGMPDTTAAHYDILVELWKAAGLADTFKYPSHIGFGLDACSSVNFGTNKTGNGALAPVHFQRKQFGTVIDYCLNDVALTKRLFDKIVADGTLLDPRDRTKTLTLRKPE